MRSLIFYDNALTIPQEEGESARLSIADIKQGAQDARDKGGEFYLREANQWRGELEVDGNRYPDAVFLLHGGDNPSLFEKLRKAYETVGVEVQDCGSDATFRPAATEDGPRTRDLSALKAEATALGIPFTADVTETTLLDAIRVRQAALASVQAGAGDALSVNETVNRNNARVGAGDANARVDNRDPADMATEAEDGTKLENAKGEDAGASGEENAGEPVILDVDAFDALDEGEQETHFDALKAEADRLGVEYAPNIGYATLHERVTDAREAD